MSELHDAIGSVAPYLDRYGYAAVFGALLLESFGLPLPGEAMLIAGGRSRRRAGCIWPLFSPALARRGGRRQHRPCDRAVWRPAAGPLRRPHRDHESRLTKVEVFFRRYGGQVVLVARFLLCAS